MIVAVSICAGLLLRLAIGGSISALSRVQLRGELVLILLLVAQSLAPTMRLGGLAGDVLRLVWISTFPLLVALTLANRRQPGLLLMGLGVLLNFLVVVANQGMPVSALAIRAVNPSAILAIPTTDLVHVMGVASTKLPWLADLIPLTGPGPLQNVVSAGDCLLFCGVCAFLGLVRASEVAPHIPVQD